MIGYYIPSQLLRKGLSIDRFDFKEQGFSRVKIKQFAYIWSENSDVLVTSPTPQLQEIILIPIWMI